MSYYIFRTKSTARLCSRVERTSQLPHGEPATVSGLLTQEVLMPWGSRLLARPLDLLGEALTTPISVSFPSHSQKVEVKAIFLRRHEHCLCTASTPKEVSGALVLLLPHPFSEHTWLSLGRREGSYYGSHSTQSKQAEQGIRMMCPGRAPGVQIIFVGRRLVWSFSFLALETIPQYHGKAILVQSSNER